MVWEDGKTAPLRSKASNRCAACARRAAFENMTMLRQDAEANSAPADVLTLTSKEALVTSEDYRRACKTFWAAFRRRWGHVEYCGFVEWTTGEAPRSGGVRRLHSHWLIKGLADELDRDQVQAWASAEWKKLTGAWVVQVARLKSVGGVVSYLALHHEKMEQRPPAGWTGRRLRPSKGYFVESGADRRDRARHWLAARAASRVADPELGQLAPLPCPKIRWSRTEEAKRCALLVAERRQSRAPPLRLVA